MQVRITIFRYLLFLMAAMLVAAITDVDVAFAKTAKDEPQPAAKTCRLRQDGNNICLLRKRIRSLTNVQAASPLITIVFRNVEAILEGFVEVTGNCQVVSSGLWVVTVPPNKGIIRTAILNTESDDPKFCPGIQLPFNVLYYTWTLTDKMSASDIVEATWRSPNFTESGSFQPTLATVSIDSVDLGTGNVAIRIVGPVGASGTVSLQLTGPTGAGFTQTSSTTYASGSAVIKLFRPAIPKNNYDFLALTWNASASPVVATFRPAAPWRVLGIVRYSQYNVPNESQCSGDPNTVYIIDNLTSCKFVQATLSSSFIEQTTLNGTGESLMYGFLKSAAASSALRSCENRAPLDVNWKKVFLQVPSVTGSCNIALVPNNSVTVFRGYELACRLSLALASTDNVVNPLRTVNDGCSGCKDGNRGTDGHIDNYTDNPACGAHDIPDLGNFWTVVR